MVGKPTRGRDSSLYLFPAGPHLLQHQEGGEASRTENTTVQAAESGMYHKHVMAQTCCLSVLLHPV